PLAVLSFELFSRLEMAVDPEIEVVLRPRLLHERQRLGKVMERIDEDDGQPQSHLLKLMDDHQAAGTERRNDRQPPGAERGYHPGEPLLERATFKLFVQARGERPARAIGVATAHAFHPSSEGSA